MSILLYNFFIKLMHKYESDVIQVRHTSVNESITLYSLSKLNGNRFFLPWQQTTYLTCPPPILHACEPFLSLSKHTRHLNQGRGPRDQNTVCEKWLLIAEEKYIFHGLFRRLLKNSLFELTLADPTDKGYTKDRGDGIYLHFSILYKFENISVLGGRGRGNVSPNVRQSWLRVNTWD